MTNDESERLLAAEDLRRFSWWGFGMGGLSRSEGRYFLARTEGLQEEVCEEGSQRADKSDWSDPSDSSDRRHFAGPPW